ncbi:MAG: hypothetical protein ACK5HR_06270 [Mycoplasmatales bacterium]
MDQEQQDLQKLKVTFAKVKQKHEADLAQNNLVEIEKNKRIMVLLLDKIKEKKKQIELKTEVIDVSTNITSDQEKKQNFFSQKSHRKKTKRIHGLTIVIVILCSLFSLLCLFQYFLYQHALLLQVSNNDLTPSSILNLKFSGKFVGIVTFISFTVYVFNYKNIVGRAKIIILGLIGIVGGILSYGGVGSFSSGFFAAKGWGAIPGIILVICCYFLTKNISVNRTKKVNSLKKSKEFEEVTINLDEQKLEHLKQVEALKRAMAQKEKEAAKLKRRKRPAPKNEVSPKSVAKKKQLPEKTTKQQLKRRPDSSKSPQQKVTKIPKSELEKNPAKTIRKNPQVAIKVMKKNWI